MQTTVNLLHSPLLVLFHQQISVVLIAVQLPNLDGQSYGFVSINFFCKRNYFKCIYVHLSLTYSTTARLW